MNFKNLMICFFLPLAMVITSCNSSGKKTEVKTESGISSQVAVEETSVEEKEIIEKVIEETENIDVGLEEFKNSVRAGEFASIIMEADKTLFGCQYSALNKRMFFTRSINFEYDVEGKYLYTDASLSAKKRFYSKEKIHDYLIGLVESAVEFEKVNKDNHDAYKAFDNEGNYYLIDLSLPLIANPTHEGNKNTGIETYEFMVCFQG